MSDADTTGSGVGADVFADSMSLERTCVGSVECGSLEMDTAGAGLVICSGPASLHRSGAGALVADGEMRLLQSGAAVMIANEAEVTLAVIGILAANEVELGPDTKVLATWREALIFGAVFGVIAAVVDLAFRGICRRR